MAKTGNPYNLSDLRWRFVEQYLVDMNGTEAYLRAGYKATKEAARRAAARLLTNVDVIAAIQAEKEKRSERVQLKQDEILEELHLLSHSSIEHYQVDDHGDVTLAPGIHRRAMRAVSSLQKTIRHGEDGSIEYKTRIWLWNKPASVKMAGEHLGTFEHGEVKSQDIQEAQAKREAALAALRATLTKIRERHEQASQVIPG